MEKKIGRPLGHPDNVGKGEPDPKEAGAEGGSAFIGDQRQQNFDREKERSERKDPPLDGTISGEDIEGDQSDSRPGAFYRSERSERLSMTERKKQPLIIW